MLKRSWLNITARALSTGKDGINSMRPGLVRAFVLGPPWTLSSEPVTAESAEKGRGGRGVLGQTDSSLLWPSLTSAAGCVKIRGSRAFSVSDACLLRRVFFQERLISFAHDRELCNVLECSQLCQVAVN
jgi:hypothetical protein